MLPRKYVFISKNSWSKYDPSKPPIKATTVSNWVRELYPGKNLGIDGFRSSFVSYYLPQMNNTEKKVMATRMRTSVNVMYRSYLKLDYTSTDNLPRVKPEENTTEELL